jgi:hypothetical protein
MSSGTVIARGGLNLRRQPGSGRVQKALRRGSRLEILGRETWLRVRTRDGREGWVLSDHVEIDAEDLPVLTEAEGPQDDETGKTPALSPVCDIRPYRNTRFVGREIHADHDFFASLDRLNSFAEQCDIALYVTSSTREPGRTVRGAIAAPATRSNHLVGHAIDVNVKAAGGFYNSSALRRANLSNLPDQVRDFIALVRDDPLLRWGGDFTREDPVHFDDNLNHREPEVWASKLKSRA